MKKIFLIAFGFVFAVSLNAQGINVPAKAKEAFSKLFPQAAKVNWGKESKNEFEVSFINRETNMSVVLNGEGKLLETETDIEVNNLPGKVLQFVKEKYPHYKITEAAKIVDSKNVLSYEAEISLGKEKRDLIFDANGNGVVKKEANEKNKNVKKQTTIN